MTSDVDTSVQYLRPVQFESFYAICWPKVYRPLAATLGDRDLAREATDEAMVRAFAHWSRVRAMENPEGWVYRVAYRWAIDKLRRRNVERRVTALFRPEAPDGDPMVEPKFRSAMTVR